MSVEIRHLRAFLAVAEELSFRRASERLHMAQPALSRTIMDMEALISVRVFERSTRVVRLTPAGSALLSEARSVLDQLKSAVRKAQRIGDGELGTLQIGYNDFAIAGSLPLLVMKFRNLYPEIGVQLRSMTSPDMAEALRRQEIDVAFMIGPHLLAGLTSLTIRLERLVCLLPAGHRLASYEALTRDKLRDQLFVAGVRDTWRSFLDVVDDFCLEVGFRPRIVQEAENSDGIMGLVAAGMGVSIYVDGPWLSNRSGVIVLPFRERTPPIASVVAWNHHVNSKVVENFLETVRTTVDRGQPTSCDI